MNKHLLVLTAVAMIASSTANATEDTDRLVDCATLRGLVVAANVLSAGRESRPLDVNGWLAKFESNRARQRPLSEGLSAAASLAKTSVVANVLPAIKQTLDATVDSGYGDQYYWSAMVAVQFNSYTHVAASLVQLRDSTCH